MDSNQSSIEQFYSVTKQIQNLANSEFPRIDFLQEISKFIINFLKLDTIEIWLKNNSNFTHCKIAKQTEHSFHYETIQHIVGEQGELIAFQKEKTLLDIILISILNQKVDLLYPGFTSYGSFFTNDTTNSLSSLLNEEQKLNFKITSINDTPKSLALIPLVVNEEVFGILQIISNKINSFKEKTIELFEDLARSVAFAIITHRSQAALRERVKELSCLYNIAQVVGQPSSNKEQILNSIVEFIPSAWQYPEITVGRIILDGRIYSTSKIIKGWEKLTANISIKNKPRGVIEVFYTRMKPQLDEGPFLREERNLINVIARQIALIIESKEAEEERSKVQQQLMHADRLVTLGQLSAGIAHELNEPLSNILGFSQFIEKTPDLPPTVSSDAKKIIKSTLFARDVIKKLLLFAREMPPKIEKVNLNKVVEEGLMFFENRCIKNGIELIRILSPENPEILGDQSQLIQSLTNLVVNSMQAMPNGGKLTVETCIKDEQAALVVTDTGCGMSEEVLRKIFMPFFTTKDINEGTGLGLSVVHGIVMSHKGKVNVKSEINAGTQFELLLPRFSN